MSSKFMKSTAVLGTVTLASLLLVACGSKTADKPADLKSKNSLYM
ncbi:maltose/maltodextrin ABC transporter maltose /maltodextrin-binding protein [Streptococcus pneumoniae]|nr:maltose/maltodextrin ABC transporter maltose /maltodextrin-binding protein [Streptococcus pneumoniae]